MNANRKELPLTNTKLEAVELPSKALNISFAQARSQYQDLLFVFVSRRIRPTEEAEDVVASIFVDAYRHWNRRKGDPRLWLLGIARRKVADSLRKRKPNWTLREEDSTSNALDEFVAKAQADQAAAIIAKLPAEERDALMMQVVDELSIAEIAIILGRSEKATNSLLGRARSRVRRMTANQGNQA